MVGFLPIEDWDEFEKMTKRIRFTDFFKIERIYRYRGKFVSREKAEELMKAGKPIKIEIYFRSKINYPSYNIHKGRIYSIYNPSIAEIKEEINYENQIRGLMRNQLISRDEAVKRFDQAIDDYERNKDWRRFKKIIGSI